MSEKTYNAEYYQKNRDRILACQREYHHRTKNAERTLRVREYNRQYYLKGYFADMQFFGGISPICNFSPICNPHSPIWYCFQPRVRRYAIIWPNLGPVLCGYSSAKMLINTN
jgi:hypothetical protein